MEGGIVHRRAHTSICISVQGVVGLVRTGFRKGRGATGAKYRRAGECHHHAGHVVEDFAGEPKGPPPRQAQFSIQLDCAQGKSEATAGKAGAFGPAINEVKEMG